MCFKLPFFNLIFICNIPTYRRNSTFSFLPQLQRKMSDKTDSQKHIHAKRKWLVDQSVCDSLHQPLAEARELTLCILLPNAYKFPLVLKCFASKMPGFFFLAQQLNVLKNHYIWFNCWKKVHVQMNTLILKIPFPKCVHDITQ